MSHQLITYHYQDTVEKEKTRKKLAEHKASLGAEYPIRIDCRTVICKRLDAPPTPQQIEEIRQQFLQTLQRPIVL